MKIYLAGPMSGIPANNFPAFDAAAAWLRRMEFDVVSPAELDDPTDRAIALADGVSEKTWGDFLARDVKLLADGGVQGIVFLPSWGNSRGAKLEATVGLLCGFSEFWVYRGEGDLLKVSREWVKHQLAISL
jgi:hypothetical protein